MPLVSVMFNFDWVGEEVRLAGLQATQIPNPSSYCRYDLSFNFNEIAGELHLLCQYSTELFNPETIRRWLADYELLLSESVAHPEQSLGELCRRIARARSSQPENAGSAPPPTITAGQPSGEAPQPPAAAGPLTPTEQALAEIWQEVIGLETVERNDDFFDVGGHSLLAMQIIARITRVFNVELPLGTIFEAPKLGALAEVITQLRRDQPGGASVIPRRDADQKHKMLQRLANLSEAQLQELLRNPKLKDIVS
jgi:acyl carrier protein